MSQRMQLALATSVVGLAAAIVTLWSETARLKIATQHGGSSTLTAPADPTLRMSSVGSTQPPGDQQIRAMRDGDDLLVTLGLPHVGESRIGEAAFPQEIHVVASHYELGRYRADENEEATRALAFLETTLHRLLVTLPGVPDVSVTIRGLADATPVRPGARYSGDLGRVTGVPYYTGDGEYRGAMTLIPGVTLLINESVGFLRGYDMERVLRSSPLLARSRMTIVADTTSAVGGAYRRVEVTVVVRSFFADRDAKSRLQ